ncbi:unnamed protein product [Dibothriocephalus latus]|uniref:G-protein coupled receptors family 1 profile domain-containing protein n=1 Tax=Dibothriocephalus latus TaxID=60516 RepID=A0A3P6QD60_DIBLA|nr:unnamed protein product [Dibothriocephalus latus]
MVTLIPLSILIVFSLQISRGLQQSDYFRRKQTGQPEHRQIFPTESGSGESMIAASSAARRVKLTLALLIVIITFPLFMLPLVPVCIIQIISYNVFPSSCIYLVAPHTCSYVAALGSQMNSMANFFVYIVY